MPDPESNYEVGFGKPPKNTQFVKGKSGNPKGRPKGSRNLATIFERVGRERITVTENGRSRKITKKEAIVLQLTNKGVSGNLGAIRDHLRFSQVYDSSEQALSPVPHDADQSVMKTILKRIRESEKEAPEDQVNPETKNPTQEE